MSASASYQFQGAETPSSDIMNVHSDSAIKKNKALSMSRAFTVNKEAMESITGDKADLDTSRTSPLERPAQLSEEVRTLQVKCGLCGQKHDGNDFDSIFKTFKDEAKELDACEQTIVKRNIELDRREKKLEEKVRALDAREEALKKRHIALLRAGATDLPLPGMPSHALHPAPGVSSSSPAVHQSSIGIDFDKRSQAMTGTPRFERLFQPDPGAYDSRASVQKIPFDDGAAPSRPSYAKAVSSKIDAKAGLFSLRTNSSHPSDPETHSKSTSGGNSPHAKQLYDTKVDFTKRQLMTKSSPLSTTATDHGKTNGGKGAKETREDLTKTARQEFVERYVNGDW